MNSNSIVVRNSIRLLANRLNTTCTDDKPLTSQEIVMLMKGIQNMGSEWTEVQKFIGYNLLLCLF